MNANQNELLTALMEAEFACVELNLFLDTHPDDAGAQAAFAAQSQRLRELKAQVKRTEEAIEEVMSRLRGAYSIVVYDKPAQQFILDNLDGVLELMQQ